MSGDSQTGISLKAKEISAAGFTLFTQSRKASVTLQLSAGSPMSLFQASDMRTHAQRMALGFSLLEV